MDATQTPPPSVGTDTRTAYLRNTAARLVEALDNLHDQGLHVQTYNHGLTDRAANVWIDAPPPNHSIRHDCAIQSLRPAGDTGRRDVVYAAVICDCCVRWLEESITSRTRVTQIYGEEG